MKNLKDGNLKEVSEERIMDIIKLRHNDNPHHYYQPNGKVEEFVNLVGKNETFISLFVAGNGIGKTAAGMNILANIFWPGGNKWFNKESFEWEHDLNNKKGVRPETELPLFQDDWKFPKRGWIVSDPNTIQSTFIPELQKWFPRNRYKGKKRGKNFLSHFTTDTGFVFDILSYEQSVKEFESATLGFVWFDEPPPIEIYKAAVARMRQGGIIFITATPLKGSGWMYDKILCNTDQEKGSRGAVQASVWDNSIERGVRGRLKSSNIERMLAEYDEIDLLAREKGLFQHLAGLVFKKFNNKVHVVEPFDVPDDWPVWHALDTHPRVADAGLWLAVSPKNQYFVVDEISVEGGIESLVSRIKTKNTMYRVVKMLIEPAAFNFDKHTNEKPLSTRLVHKGLTYQPGSKKRRAAERRIRDAFDYEIAGNEMVYPPELFIFKNCIKTIYEIQHYQWDEWRGVIAGRKTPKEVPMDKDDHFIEDLGRILTTEPKYFPPEPKGANKIPLVPNNDPYD
ncbi:MAG: hypothetical protein U9R08_02975 [Nanoarchaeota archaeon]|nr:hypothetical protein [Nanoarchaeota archaeon]